VSELSYSCGWFNCKYSLHLITLRFNAVSCEYVPVIGRLYSIQYKGIFGMPDKARCYTCEEAGPLRLDFQREEVKIHHVIASTQDCWP
jgi:hypothetical protein